MFQEIKNRERHEWVDHGAHYLKLATIDYDINIIPLVENKFNLGKSALKWYESSALNKPVCTLAADVGPYKEIEHGKTGLLFNGEDDFVEKIGALIENEKLRRELAQNAHDWVWENRDAEKWAPKLMGLMVELREDYIQEIGDLRELIGASEEVWGHTMEGKAVCPV
jgi:glycosyltransferase involved in cell wall biosynthesis